MMSLLSKQDYTGLYLADVDQGGEVARILNSNGQPDWTVCPNCGCDDFTHLTGCELEKKIWNELRVKLAGENDE
jgi:hypothetical protein